MQTNKSQYKGAGISQKISLGGRGENCENVIHETHQENKSGHENGAYGGCQPPPPPKKLEGLTKAEKRFRQEEMRKIEKISA
jgi:hypothetical protein